MPFMMDTTARRIPSIQVRPGLVALLALALGLPAACGKDDKNNDPGRDGGADASQSSDAGHGSGDGGDDGSSVDGDVSVDGGWAHPRITDTWQWQLTGALNTSYDVDAYDIDMFDASEGTIASLKALGRTVVCYFAAGSAEDWRPDYQRFTEEDKGNDVDGWPGESWLDIRSANVRDIMEDRLDMAAEKGCQAVEPDLVDGYAADSGFPLTFDDQIEYNRWLAAEAHQRMLAVGLKNDLDQVIDLVDHFDFAVNEECHDYDECYMLQPFLNAGKPVWNAEYADSLGDAQARAVTLCPLALGENLRTIILPLELDDSFRVSCD